MTIENKNSVQEKSPIDKCDDLYQLKNELMKNQPWIEEANNIINITRAFDLADILDQYPEMKERFDGTPIYFTGRYDYCVLIGIMLTYMQTKEKHKTDPNYKIAEIGGDVIGKTMNGDKILVTDSCKSKSGVEINQSKNKVGINLKTYSQVFKDNFYDFSISALVCEEESGIVETTLDNENNQIPWWNELNNWEKHQVAAFVLLATQAKITKIGGLIINETEGKYVEKKDQKHTHGIEDFILKYDKNLSEFGLVPLAEKEILNLRYGGINHIKKLDIFLKIRDHDLSQEEVLNIAHKMILNFRK